MKMDSKIFSGMLAVGIYFGIILLVFFYFGYRSQQPPKHYVTKNTKAIAVSLSASKPNTHTKKNSHVTQSKPLTKKRSHRRPRPIKDQKPAPVRPALKKKAPKKIKPKRLFAHVKTGTKSHPKPKKSPRTSPAKQNKNGKTPRQLQELTSQQKARDKGIENRYLAGVQNKLYGWPSQSNFAGATFTIGLTIYPSGRFEYVVLKPSSNPEFNRTIRQYLSQLKSIGFDPTPHGKTYKFKVDIVAK